MASEPRNFVEAFRDVAVPVLTRHPHLRVVWETGTKGEAYTLRILKNSPTGFDVGVEVQTYGLYPLAGDWHGSPLDITSPGMSIVEKCSWTLGVVRRLLSTDMRLRVRCAGGHPYKWLIEASTPKGRELYEETGLLLFRYFSARSEAVFQNDQLPPLGFTSGMTPFESIEPWQ